jgi:undecaprenyl-diphosphatase
MIEQLNDNIFKAINHFAGSNVVLDKLGIIIAEYFPIFFILLLIYLWFKKDEFKKIVLYSGYSVILGIFLNFLITLFYFHPRPFMEQTGKLLVNHIPETSFPSDHTTFMLSIAFMLLYFKRTRKVGVILFLLGLIGGISRVFCGLHYPFDIIGSVVVAAVSSCIIFLFKNELQKLNKLILSLYFKVLKHEN